MGNFYRWHLGKSKKNNTRKHLFLAGENVQEQFHIQIKNETSQSLVCEL